MKNKLMIYRRIHTYIHTQKGHQKDIVKCLCFTSSFLKENLIRIILLEGKLHVIVIMIVIVIVADIHIIVSLQKCRSSSFGFKVSLLLTETEFSCLKDFNRQHLHPYSSKQKVNILWLTKFKQLTQFFMKVWSNVKSGESFPAGELKVWG